MRRHLWSCFERRQISMFPYRKLRHLTVKSVDEVPLYCVCRMPELPNTRRIECSGCKRWYHTDSCISVPHLSSNNTWYYNRCIRVVFFFSSLICNTAQLVYVYSCIYILYCSLCTDIILKLLTNWLAITMPYSKWGPKFSR